MTRFVRHISIVVALCASVAYAQTKVLMIPGSGTPMVASGDVNQFYFGDNADSPAEFSTRALDATHPSVAGVGRGLSVIEHDGTTVGRFVTTANFAGTTQEVANCTDITLDGNLPVPTAPYDSAPEIALGAFGSTLVADGWSPKANLTNSSGLRVQNFRGTGISLFGGSGHVINNVDVLKCWTGVQLNGDHGLSNSMVVGCRDTGVYSVGGANNWTIGNHAYGHAVACYNLTQDFRSLGDIYADCYIGYLGNAASIRSFITGTTFQYCKHRSIVAKAATLHCYNCYVRQSPVTSGTFTRLSGTEGTFTGSVGLDIQESGFEFIGGEIHLTGASNGGTPTAGATAVWLNGDNADGTHIDTRISNDDDTVAVTDGAVAVRITGEPIVCTLRILASGFTDANDKLLIIEDGDIKGLNVTYYVSAADYASPSTRFTVPATWDDNRVANNSSVTLINDETGASKLLTE